LHSCTYEYGKGTWQLPISFTGSWMLLGPRKVFPSSLSPPLPAESLCGSSNPGRAGHSACSHSSVHSLRSRLSVSLSPSLCCFLCVAHVSLGLFARQFPTRDGLQNGRPKADPGVPPRTRPSVYGSDDPNKRQRCPHCMLHCMLHYVSYCPVLRGGCARLVGCWAAIQSGVHTHPKSAVGGRTLWSASIHFGTTGAARDDPRARATPPVARNPRRQQYPPMSASSCPLCGDGDPAVAGW